MTKQWDAMDTEEKLESLRELLLRAGQADIQLRQDLVALRLRVKALEDIFTEGK